MEHILDEGVGRDREQDGVLEAEHQLDRRALGQGGGVGMQNEVYVDKSEQRGQRDHPQVEGERDRRRTLHKVHPVLRQPVEGLQEQQQRKQRDELGREVVPENRIPSKKSKMDDFLKSELT